jgi:hypothetical protein
MFVVSLRGWAMDEELAKRFLEEAPKKWREYEALLRPVEQHEETTLDVLSTNEVLHNVVDATVGNAASQVLLKMCRAGEKERICGTNSDYYFDLTVGPEPGKVLSIQDVQQRNANVEGYALRHRSFFVRTIAYAYPLNFIDIVGSTGFRVTDAAEIPQDSAGRVRIDFGYDLVTLSPKDASLPKSYSGTLVLEPRRYWAIKNVNMTFDDPVKEVGRIELENQIESGPHSLPVVTSAIQKWYDPAGNTLKVATSEYKWKEAKGGDRTFTLSSFGFPEPTFAKPSHSRMWAFVVAVALLVSCVGVLRYRHRKKTAVSV